MSPTCSIVNNTSWTNTIQRFNDFHSTFPVVSAQPRTCKISRQVKVTSPSGYIASVVTEESGCGAENVPWVIEAKPGQRINLTLYDFSRVDQNGAAITRPSRGCVMYAYVRDETSQERHSLCAGGERERHVFTSLSNQVNVHLVKSHFPEGKRNFMIYYEGKPYLISISR